MDSPKVRATTPIGRLAMATILRGLRRLRSTSFNLVKVLRANPLTLIGFVVVLFISVTAFLVAVVPPVSQTLLGHPMSIAPYDPNALLPCPVIGNSTVCAQPPSAEHLFGTDRSGRDVFSRVLVALPLDLAIGFAVAGFSLLLGGGLGLVAGFWDRPWTIGGIVSLTIMRVTDVFLAFPSLVLALAIAATLGRGTVPCVLAILLTWWPYYVRLTRGEVLAVKHQPYIVAARSAGVSEGRILFRHVFRNILEPLVVYFTMDVGTVLVVFSTISFIGIGVPPEVPEWGNMVSAYGDYLLLFPWMVIFPGLAIFVTVLAFSLLGDGLRDILDPRSRRALTQAVVPATSIAMSSSRAEA
ncbi:MAG: ABC transporter permease [Methanobacteriota archaeon]|nr:MAG: ABC transporter permease [Euryarchaeota archaeon]